MIIDTTVEQLHGYIMDALREKRPFSFVRCGDGDTIITQPHRLEWRDMYERVSKRNLGYVLKEEDSIEVKNNLEFAICNSDVLGIAETRHIEKNIYWKEQHNILETIMLTNEGGSKTRKYCTLDAHVHLLKSGYLNTILSSVEQVVVIGARNVEDKLKNKYRNISNIEFHKIPPEVRFENEMEFSTFYPKIHGEIIQKIKSTDRKGQLCIFGAGFVGKNFGAIFKQAGGVAVDIGSVFDLWDGKQTRGKNRGKESIITEYIL